VGEDFKKKNDHNCIINIFCGDGKCDDNYDIKSDGKCIINIFCNSEKDDDPADNEDNEDDDW